MSLRSISSDNFVIVDTTRGADIIGETDFTSALSTLHEKAIYLIEGKLFQVEKLDFDGRRPRARGGMRLLHRRHHLHAGDDPRRVQHRVGRRGGALDHRPDPPLKSHGDVRVASRVVGFKKIKFYTNENVGSGELDLPEQQMHTTSYWLTLPRQLMATLPYSLETAATASSGWPSRCGRWRSCC